jgi:RNA polymerase-binding transcription factor DksA
MNMETRKRPIPRRKPKAATAEILGVSAKSKPIPRKWQKHYGHLLALREALQRRRLDLTNDALSEQPSFSTHMADAGTDTYDRDLALSMLSSEQDAIYEIDQAIDRIHSNTYGVCELTTQPIEPARLEAVPWTRFSAAAEKQLEREGTRKRTRLGYRETVVRESPVKAPEET